MPAFTVTDTRKQGSGVTLQRLASPAHHQELTALARTYDNQDGAHPVLEFRSDLDLKQQKREVELHNSIMCQRRRSECREDTALTEEDAATSLKMLIHEAERFQLVTGLTAMRKVGVDRLKTFSAETLKTIYQSGDIETIIKKHGVAAMICRDVDLIVGMPEETFKGSNMSCLQAANKAVKDLPLWRV